MIFPNKPNIYISIMNNSIIYEKLECKFVGVLLDNTALQKKNWKFV